jgi:hypothetical protein
MAVKVVFGDGEFSDEYPDGEGWSVQDGVITVTDEAGDQVASYPDGSWVTVVRQEDDG